MSQFGSHEVVLSFIFSLEALSTVLVVIVIICRTHNVGNHRHVVVSSVVVSHCLAAGSWLLLRLCGLLLLLQFGVVHGLKMIGDLLDLL